MRSHLYGTDQHAVAEGAIWKGERYRHDKIRLAYLSADFREHAVARLTARLFETHDKSRFETTAIAFGPESDDEMRTRLTAAFDRFIDVRAWRDRDVALLLRELEIDIAIDLQGVHNLEPPKNIGIPPGAGSGELSRISWHDGRQSL